MNYYDAREIQDGPMKGKFHYTRRNDDQIWPVGYCSRLRDCPNGHNYGESCDLCENGVVTIPEEEYADHAHDTPEEARECFRRYLLDDISEEEYGDWTGCAFEGCDTPTKKGLTSRRPLGNGYALCDPHRTPENYEKLMPPIGQITASY